eukprot:2212312-Amphidinium_carterae.1
MDCSLFTQTRLQRFLTCCNLLHPSTQKCPQTSERVNTTTQKSLGPRVNPRLHEQPRVMYNVVIREATSNRKQGIDVCKIASRAWHGEASCSLKSSPNFSCNF